MRESPMLDHTSDRRTRVLLLDCEECLPLLGDLQQLLSAEERTRCAAYALSAARMEFIVGRGVLRLLLGRQLGCAAKSVPLCRGRSGKPAVCDTSLGMEFNVAHSHGLLALAVGNDGPVGIDVERVDPEADVVALAETAWGPAAAAEFVTLSPDEERRRVFFQRWVRVEAERKRAGSGIFLQTVSGDADDGTSKLPTPELEEFALSRESAAFVGCLAFARGAAVEVGPRLHSADVLALFRR